MIAKIISSLEKCFLDESAAQKPELFQFSFLKNERYSLQVCYQTKEVVKDKELRYFQIESPLAPYIRTYAVQNIPSEMPVFRNRPTDGYLRTQPGMYPDLLQPMENMQRLPVNHNLHALWLEIDPHGELDASVYPITCIFTDTDGKEVCRASAQAEVINALLPPQKMQFTQWFYTDCLMQYYGTKAFSPKHWRLIENFMRNAKKYGMNMILTPVLTPALDTYEGGERPTTQLVEITLEDGEYRFDFSKLGKWVDLCDKVGIEYLEICHFFTQWGAKACPKVVAKVSGKKKTIFGWHTASDSPEYTRFLQALIPAMLKYLKEKNGADKRCYFHVSDEPAKEHLEQYKKVSNILKPLLKGYPLMDALSDYDFYETGATDHPVVAIDHAEPFLEHQAPGLWTYYCLSQYKQVSNRFFAMPSARNRIIGTQFYKYNIAGFLHWGYNFYNSQYSYHRINPFLCSDGEGFAPSGDTYSVYPGAEGEPWPSIRQVVFGEALQDVRALQLCETLCGREETLRLLEADMTFKDYPQDADYILNMRQRINRAIAEKAKERKL